jgi:hypothetical protein
VTWWRNLANRLKRKHVLRTARKSSGGLTIIRAVRTSTACPDQWDAWDADGNYWYLRYRGGRGTAGRTHDIDYAEFGFFLDDKPVDIELDEFCEHAGITLLLLKDVVGMKWENPPQHYGRQ